MMRWCAEETDKLLKMRKILKKELVGRRQLPDVVGDRRLLRFLRGHNQNVEKASKMFAKFLRWRDEFEVDSIRDNILYNKLKSPVDFPCGKKILQHVSQFMLSHEALDNHGNPIALEYFNFIPETVLKEITKKEYMTFMIYTLEYKILLLEQLADEREKAYLSNPSVDNTAPYGILLSARVIRDLNGFGLSHIGSDGQTVIKWILEIAVDNYPELLFRCNMINVPWIFNSIWFFMKGMMDSNTVKKVTITGTDFYKELVKEIPEKSIPVDLGGGFVPNNVLYDFDLTEEGPFYYPNCQDVYDKRRLSGTVHESNLVRIEEKQGDVEDQGEQCSAVKELRKRKISMSKAKRGTEESKAVLVESENDDTDESKTERASNCSDSNTKLLAERNEIIRNFDQDDDDIKIEDKAREALLGGDDRTGTPTGTSPASTSSPATTSATNKDLKTWAQVLTPDRNQTEKTKTGKEKKKKKKKKVEGEEVPLATGKKEKKIKKDKDKSASLGASKAGARAETIASEGAQREELLSNLGNLPQSHTHQPLSKSIITPVTADSSPAENRQVSHILKAEKTHRSSAKFGDARTRRKSVNKADPDASPEIRTRRSSRHCAELPVMPPERSCRVASCSVQ